MISQLWKITYSPFYLFLLGYFKNHQYKFIGPILGNNISPSKLDQIKNFRIQYYGEKNAHLIPKTKEEEIIQNIIDQKSYHVYCESENEILGALRLTPYPFDRVPTDIRFCEHLELSRLLVKKSGMQLGKHLLIYTGLQTILQSDNKGFVAICKMANFNIFKKFGLKKISTINFDDREDEYLVIEATFSQITKSTLSYVLKNSHFETKNRLKNIYEKLQRISGAENEI